MHDEQAQFVKTVRSVFPAYFEGVTVLEVGSYDVNGSVRPVFRECDYVGLDLIEGPGVDLVCPGHLFASERRFDTVISAECFEHNPHWRETFWTMAAHTRPGGMVVVTCASEGRPVHGTANSNPDASPGTVQTGSDYYANLSAEDFETLDLPGRFSAWKFARNRASQDLYFVGFRHGGADRSRELDRLAVLCRRNEDTSLAIHAAIEVIRAGDIGQGILKSRQAVESATPACQEQALRILGWALRLGDCCAESELALRKALELSPTADTWFHLALTLRRSGRQVEARDAATMAVSLAPAVPGYRQLLSTLAPG